MKILVQHCQSRMYLGDGDLWVRDLAEAREFVTPGEASMYCRQYISVEAQIVMSMGDPRYDVVFAVDGKFQRPPPRPDAT